MDGVDRLAEFWCNCELCACQSGEAVMYRKENEVIGESRDSMIIITQNLVKRLKYFSGTVSSSSNARH